ncbi:helix-turn-helix domain-containing protein [Rubrivirga sp.]|uniref:helix-turn-helix domain-containing protein n=1 Tax=Rubrivirga sp. TaxID=1885344 RepID=UPI003C7207D6
MPAKHTVRLSDEQRVRIDRTIRTGIAHARTVAYARALLLVDEADGGMAWSDEKAADALGVCARTVARLRRRFCTEGADEALRPHRSAPGRPFKIDGVAEAHLIALACSEPPEGQAAWSLRLLADEFVALGVCEPVSYETVRRTLKKRAPAPTARRDK